MVSPTGKKSSIESVSTTSHVSKAKKKKKKTKGMEAPAPLVKTTLVEGKEKLDDVRKTANAQAERGATLATSSSPEAISEAQRSRIGKQIYRDVLDREAAALQKARGLQGAIAVSDPSGSKKSSSLLSKIPLMRRKVPSREKYNQAFKLAMDAKRKMEGDVGGQKVGSEQWEQSKSYGTKEIASLRKTTSKIASAWNDQLKTAGPASQLERIGFLKTAIENDIKLGLVDLYLFDLDWHPRMNAAESGFRALRQEREDKITEIKNSIGKQLDPYIKDLLEIVPAYYSRQTAEALDGAIQKCQDDIGDADTHIQNKREKEEREEAKFKSAKEIPAAMKTILSRLDDDKPVYILSLSIASLEESDGELNNLQAQLAERAADPASSNETSTSAEQLQAKIGDALLLAKKEVFTLRDEIEKRDKQGQDVSARRKKLESTFSSRTEIPITDEERELLDAISAGATSSSAYASTPSNK